MKIYLRINLTDPDTATLLASDPVIGKATFPYVSPPVGGIWFKKAIDVENSVFDRILEFTRTSPGIKFLRHMTFTNKEISQFSHFELFPKKILNDSDKEYDATWTYYNELPLIRTEAKWPIKLLDRLYLASCRVKENAIAVYGHWTNEYVCGKVTSELINSCDLTGIHTIPVFCIKSKKELTDCNQLFSNSILPKALNDASVFETVDDNSPESTPRRYACLSYSYLELNTFNDFNRTAEPWGPWDFPSWVISHRAYEQMLTNKIPFRVQPVFDCDSEIYQVYIKKWKAVLTKLTSNSNHQIMA
ncbi:MAG: hypothetical protein HKM93_01975 [Desulfobacteraceae bacterium]|nr:hypothetical protein [Desulfobacteraceae bacterium]